MADGNSQDKSHIASMSDDEIMAYLRQRKVEQQKRIAQEGAEARKKLEAYCLKTFKLTLQQIYTASGKTQELKSYRNPATPDAQPYTYSGRGKVPGWLKGADGKPNPAYEVRAN